MSTRKLYATDVLVLSHFDLGEADRVLSVLTPVDGKLKVIAKGVRRPTSRLGGSLEPFAELRLSLVRGRTFDIVTQAAVIHPWLRLRDSLASTATAWYVTELADRSLEERHPAEPLYAILHRAYTLLDAGMAPGRVARWFELRLADELGFRPEIDRCVECDRLIEPTESVRWVPALGGVVCPRHGGPTLQEAGISTDALRVLKAYQRMDAEAIAGLRLPPGVEREAEEAIRAFLVYVLEREPRSRRFLDEVRPGTGATDPRTAPSRAAALSPPSPATETAPRLERPWFADPPPASVTEGADR